MKENFFGKTNELAGRVAYLIAGYISKTLTEKEHDELDEWVNESDANMKLFEDLTDEKNIEANLKWMNELKTKETFERLKAEGKFDLPSRKSNTAFWWIAASVLLIVAAYFFYTNSQKTNDKKIELANNEADKKKNAADGVLLVLEDSTQIDLSKLQNGTVEAGSGSDLSKENDSILNYGQSGALQNHILKTPAAKMFQLKLPDGSRVWLNAQSSLKYPTQFPGNQRVVFIEGEGYFEVANDVTKPFKVVMPDSSSVSVLGTHFNINAYQNENKNVALIEGSVSVSKNAQTVKLSPGSQVAISENGLGKISAANMNTITGWTKGLFVFKDADIKEIMAQLEQWYNIKTVYKGNIGQKFNATFSRKEDINQILKFLELNGYVHFKTENNIVYVLP